MVIDFWILCRKPLEGTVAENVLKHGTGVLNIDGCRIGLSKNVPASPSRTAGNSLSGSVDGSLRRETGEESGHNPNMGRWPANLVLSHSPGCELISTKGITSRISDRPKEGEGRIDRTNWRIRPTPATVCGYGGEDDREVVEQWHCVEDCPVAELDRQSGRLRSSKMVNRGTHHWKTSFDHGSASVNFRMGRQDGIPCYGDVGSTSRFFKTFKGIK